MEYIPPPVMKHLRPGGTHALLDGSGRHYRWTITSPAFKGENDPGSTVATWIIGTPAGCLRAGAKRPR